MKLNAIPTQDGSKRNPFKIKKLLAGKPMIGWLMQVVENLGVFDATHFMDRSQNLHKACNNAGQFHWKKKTGWLYGFFYFWSRIGSRNYNSISSIRY